MSDRFDRLARALSGAMTRRRFLTRFGSGLIVGGAAFLASGSSGSAKGPFDVNGRRTELPKPFVKTDDGQVILKPPPFQVNQTLVPPKFDDPEEQPPPFRVNGTFVDKGPPFTEPDDRSDDDPLGPPS